MISAKMPQDLNKLSLYEAKKTTVQDNLPKDSQDLSGLKWEIFSPPVQDSGSVLHKTHTYLKEIDWNSSNNKGKWPIFEL